MPSSKFSGRSGENANAPAPMTALSALSPLDGRYAAKLDSLRSWFSEHALIRERARVEIAWLTALSRAPDIPEVPAMSADMHKTLADIVERFSEADAAAVKAIEARTNHDVKALEYWIKERVGGAAGFARITEFIHFACTSEDINNLAHGLMVAGARREVLLPALAKINAALDELATAHADLAMLSRTHGQPATPTTLGKEMANVAARLAHAMQAIERVQLRGKMNGAVGNYNAHLAAYPDVDWEKVARGVVEGLGLEFNAFTTQIEPHDSLAELFDAVARCNTVLLDLCRDIWSYIALGYFKQRLREGEVGSSTMPHKVNPIDFENAEGNIGVANALLRHLADKLPVSRMQRDLSDSTVLRNMGVAFGHALLAWDSCLRGLCKLEVNPARLAEDLDANWEVLAEPIQTVMRRYAIANPYEQLKELTRGRAITRDALHAFIRALAIPEPEKKRLLALTPANYLGKAAELARRKQR